MKIQDYYQELNARSQEIFQQSLKDPSLISAVHSAASEIFQLSEPLSDSDEKALFQVVCSQLESSGLALSLGLYRPAISALRLALELGLGCVFFSANKLLHREWQANGDLKWSAINSDNDGALSTRFSKAFVPEIAEDCSHYRHLADSIYRQLSEYVHGNSETWHTTGIALKYNEELRSLYATWFKDVVKVLKFAYCCRYLDEKHKERLEVLYPALSELHHLAAIRTYFGIRGSL